MWKKTVLSILLCLFLLPVIGSQASNPPIDSALVIASITQGNVQFYKVQNDGALVSVGSLSNSFSVHPVTTGEWLIPDLLTISVSPNGDSIAFSARRQNEYALFIYELANDNLRQVTVPFWSVSKWSPNGNYVLLNPRPFQIPDEEQVQYSSLRRYVYDTLTDVINPITEGLGDIPAFARWLPDSSGFQWFNGVNMRVVDRDGQNLRWLNNPLIEITDANLYNQACYEEWSAETSRFYFGVGCVGYFDTNLMQVYSLDLNGVSNMVVDFEPIIPEDFLKMFIIDIIVRVDGVYIPMEVNYRNGDTHWQTWKIDNNDQIQLIDDMNLGTELLTQLRNAQLSPDGENIAYIGILPNGRIGGMRVVNLPTGNTISEVLLPSQHVCEARWVNNTQIVYELRDYFCYLSDIEVAGSTSILDITTNTTTPLDTQIGSTNWILPTSAVQVADLGNLSTSIDSNTDTD